MPLVVADCRMKWSKIKIENEMINDLWIGNFSNHFMVRKPWKDNKRRKKIAEYFGSVRTPCLRLSETKHPKTIEELTSLMEQAIPVGVETWYEKSVTGEKYLEYGVGCQYPTEIKIKSLLAWHWNSFIRQLEQNPHGTLYWRIKPEYSEHENKHTENIMLYS